MRIQHPSACSNQSLSLLGIFHIAEPESALAAVKSALWLWKQNGPLVGVRVQWPLTEMRHVCAKMQACPPNTGVAHSSGQRNALSVCQQDSFYTLAVAEDFITWRIWRTPFAMGPALCSLLHWNIQIRMKQKHTWLCSATAASCSYCFEGVRVAVL